MIYELAGMRVDIQNRCEYTARFCKEYLSEDQASPADITARVTKEEFLAEKELSAGFSDGYVENICLYRTICQQAPLFKRMLLHASVLEYEGNGYAFLGRSGTGKSTHTRLWLEHLPNVRVINGDKPILEQKDGFFYAYGTPWQGKEGWGCKAKAPLRGLCFLEQAKENKVQVLSPSEAANRLFAQVLLPTEESAAVATLELLDALLACTPTYLLSCDISEEAVKTSFEKMTGQVYAERKK